MSFKNIEATRRAPGSRGMDGPQPFLKWAGGKTQLLATLGPLVPRGARYLEPFVGGGALFFHCRPAQAILADANPHLMTAYKVVRDDVVALADCLRRYREQHAEPFYYEVRRQYNEADMSDLERAAAFIYLNKTGFNGLYRENGRGQHNVPFGRYRNPSIFDDANLRAASKALQGVELRRQGFEATLDAARAGDFIYFDPPYHPMSSTARFTAYTRGAFSETHQEQLAALFRALDARGCKVLLSNSDSPWIRALYRGFRMTRVPAVRSINCVGSGRGEVGELLVRNYVVTASRRDTSR